MSNPLAFIIEDDPDLNMIFSISLREAGFTTEAFDNGPDALTRMNEIQPSVITLDLHLPLMSGQEVLEEIRSSEELKNIRVILTTADYRLANTLQSEVDFILIKPISFKQLRDTAVNLIA